MVRAVFDVEFPVFRSVFDHLPGLDVRLVDLRGADSTVGLFWIGGAESDAVTAAIDGVPTVVETLELAASDHRTLYRVEFDPGAAFPAFHRLMVELDGTIRDAQTTGGPWQVELFLPTREALATLYDRCTKLDLSPTLKSVSDRSTAPTRDDYGLTDAQRSTLVAAAKHGYFSVPKQISLVDLADELGVSDQATSERLRRGMAALTAATLLSEATPRDGDRSERSAVSKTLD